MSTIHVHHQFHSAGHGTFFTGVVTDGSRAFRWVYDCGSKRSSRISRLVQALPGNEHWDASDQLDLLAISHFDDDHVNGMEELLSIYGVKWLALPYLDVKSRLALACSSVDDEISTARTAAFAIDPIRYLASRGLSDRVGAVMLVEGGSDAALDAGAELPDPATPPTDRPEAARASRVPGAYSPSLPSGAPRLHVRSHQHPFTAGFPVEFVFFNAELPDGRAQRSKATRKEIQAEVDAILERYGLFEPAKKVRRGWRDALRKCYTRHFGNSGAQRNNISLCLLIRPVYPERVSDCGYFDPLTSDTERVTEVAVRTDHQALLLTGDLALDSDRVDAMRAHFRDWRWSQLALTQVPHHGSIHSWKTGNAKLFNGTSFVQCVPSVSPGGKHPHPTVCLDLADSTVFHADYERCVIQTYHFDPV